MMVKRMKKWLFTAFVLVLTFVSLFILNAETVTPNSGTVTIVLQNGNTIVKEETVSFTSGDTLLKVLSESFDVKCADLNYNATTCENTSLTGTVILGLDDVLTDWTHDYLAIYVDGTYSTVGVDYIMLSDGMTITFIKTNVGEN